MGPTGVIGDSIRGDNGDDTDTGATIFSSCIDQHFEKTRNTISEFEKIKTKKN
jgi:hypothetical protein